MTREGDRGANGPILSIRGRVLRLDPYRDGYILASGAWILAILVGAIAPGTDATQFYLNSWPDPYRVSDYASGAGFYYSPAAAMMLAPLTTFGLPVFAAILSGLGLAALYGILGRWAFAGLLFPPVWWDISAGNINTLIGWVAIAGLVRPGLWAIPMLTKVTPGIGLLWFGLKRQWRPMLIGFVLAGLVCLPSVIVAPDLWAEWVTVLAANGTGYVGTEDFTVPIPVLPRLAVAFVLLVVAAQSNSRWLLPIVVTVAMPVLWYTALAPLVAIPVLVRWSAVRGRLRSWSPRRRRSEAQA